MGIFDKFFGKKKNTLDDQNSEQAVIVQFLYGIDGLEPLHRLEEKLRNLINQKGVGEYDGHDIATDYSDGFLYMYGPDAETLFRAVRPELENTDFLKGAIAKLRFGPPEDGVREIKIPISE